MTNPHAQALFVGGPMDGRRIIVERHGPSEFRAALAKGFPPFATTAYHRFVLVTASREERIIYAQSGVDAVAALVDGYPPFKETT